MNGADINMHRAQLINQWIPQKTMHEQDRIGWVPDSLDFSNRWCRWVVHIKDNVLNWFPVGCGDKSWSVAPTSDLKGRVASEVRQRTHFYWSCSYLTLSVNRTTGLLGVVVFQAITLFSYTFFCQDISAGSDQISSRILLTFPHAENSCEINPSHMGFMICNLCTVYLAWLKCLKV